jgi:hypothetical protein
MLGRLAFTRGVTSALLLALPTLGQSEPASLWNELAPPSRMSHTVILDPIRDRLVLFGGIEDRARNEVWVLPLAGASTWSLIDVPVPLPSPRRGHSAIYDPIGDRMIVFGGSLDYSGSTRRNDVWALTLSGNMGWTELSPVGTPPSSRVEHSAIFDPDGSRMIVFGGHDGASRNDVWALALSGSPSWSELSPAGTPPRPRNGHATIYDAPRDRMVIHGGEGSIYTYSGGPKDTWALSLSGPLAWTEIVTSGPLPDSATHYAAVHDAPRDRMVLLGGYSFNYRGPTGIA